MREMTPRSADYYREYYKANKERLLAKQRERRKLLKKAGRYERDPEKRKAYMKRYREENRELIQTKRAEYRSKNASRLSDEQQARYWRDPEKFRERRREYGKQTRKQHRDKNQASRNRQMRNSNFRIAANLRSRVSIAVRRNFKAGSAVVDLGCSIEAFKIYIEQKFRPGMSWDNWSHNTWHLDHIKPLASFDLSDREQFLQACHYTNYQPLWASENLKKGARE